ncbi:MAG: GNAT family N-acetyltransferase [Clostridium sp.]
MIIRRENSSDFKQVGLLIKEAFNNNFEKELVENLRNNPKHITELSLIAEDVNELAGHILFTEIIVKGTSDYIGGLALAPLAVKPSYQNIGVGRALIHQGLLLARALGYKFVIVLGHSDYYKKFDFVNASTFGIKCPFEVPDDVFMAIELRENSLHNISGIVEYLPEFSS